MKYDITSDACRICLRKSSSCRSIFTPLEGDIAPYKKLNLIAGLSVTEQNESPKLPQNVCKQCEISVNLAFNLRSKARKSDQILSSYFNNLNQENIIVELANGRKFKLSKELTLKIIPSNKPKCNSESFESIQVDENDEDDGDDGDDYDDDDDDDDDDNDDDDDDDDNDENIDNNENELESKTMSDIKEKTDYEEVQNKFYEKGKNVFLNNKHDNEEDVANFRESKPLENYGNEHKNDPLELNKNNNIENQQNIKTENQPIYDVQEIAKKIQASNQYELVSWKKGNDSNAVPTLKLRLKETEEKPLSKDFICDVCGNAYTQKHRLMEHMRRHNPENPYACELCEKRFKVPEGLRRHILTHGAQKPYKCNFCHRCFYQPSQRKAHEKVHSGAKPFVCKICNKAFAYSGSLRKHFLIHENKKLYRCDYCDKEFRLQHHMKQHEETQIHKDAIAVFLKSVNNMDKIKNEV